MSALVNILVAHIFLACFILSVSARPDFGEPFPYEDYYDDSSTTGPDNEEPESHGTVYGYDWWEEEPEEDQDAAATARAPEDHKGMKDEDHTKHPRTTKQSTDKDDGLPTTTEKTEPKDEDNEIAAAPGKPAGGGGMVDDNEVQKAPAPPGAEDETKEEDEAGEKTEATDESSQADEGEGKSSTGTPDQGHNEVKDDDYDRKREEWDEAVRIENRGEKERQKKGSGTATVFYVLLTLFGALVFVARVGYVLAVRWNEPSGTPPPE